MAEKLKWTITVCICALLLMAAVPPLFGQTENAQAILPQTRNGYTSSEPFRINSNADFAASSKVTGGDGSAGNPWIIENYEVDGAGHGYSIYIGNTTDYFVVRNCYLHHAGGNDAQYFWNSGLLLYNVQNGNVSDNKILNNGHGVYLNASSNNEIIENEASNNEYGGIGLAYHSNNNIIIGNEISNNMMGIILSISSNNNVIENTVESNDMDGINHASSSNNNIIGNKIILNTKSGINMGESRDNNIISNNISRNEKGISLISYCNRNNIVNNTVSNNDYGISLLLSRNNKIYHNNILNNREQAWDTSGNQWDSGYPSGGNYWSDYSGADEFAGPNQDIPGSDGIGDTPYTKIDTVFSPDIAQDNYPLMQPFNGTLPTPPDPDATAPGKISWMIVIVAAAISTALLAILLIRRKSKPAAAEPPQAAKPQPGSEETGREGEHDH